MGSAPHVILSAVAQSATKSKNPVGEPQVSMPKQPETHLLDTSLHEQPKSLTKWLDPSAADAKNRHPPLRMTCRGKMGTGLKLHIGSAPNVFVPYVIQRQTRSVCRRTHVVETQVRVLTQSKTLL